MPRSAQSFLHSILVVLSGSIAAQAIPVVGSLILARLYIPSDFGVYAAWLGMASVGAVVMTGRFEMALPLENSRRARRMAAVATALTVLAACLPASILALSLYASGLIAQSVTTPMAMLLVPTSALMAWSQLWQSWAAADERFKHLSVLRVSQTSAVTGLQIGAGWMSPSAESLAWAHSAGVAFAACFGALTMWRYRCYQWPAAPALVRLMTSYWRKRRRFPKYSLPADTISTFGAQLPLIMIASRYGGEAAGYFAMTIRILGAPIGLIGASILDVFRRRAAAAYQARGECETEFLSTLKMLAAASFVLVVVVAPTSEEAFAMVFGENWRMSGVVAIWLLPMIAMRFMASPLSYVVYVAEKQHLDLIWQLVLLTVIAFTLLMPTTFKHGVLAYSAGYSVMYVIYLGMTFKFSRGGLR